MKQEFNESTCILPYGCNRPTIINENMKKNNWLQNMKFPFEKKKNLLTREKEK